MHKIISVLAVCVTLVLLVSATQGNAMVACQQLKIDLSQNLHSYAMNCMASTGKTLGECESTNDYAELLASGAELYTECMQMSTEGYVINWPLFLGTLPSQCTYFVEDKAIYVICGTQMSLATLPSTKIPSFINRKIVNTANGPSMKSVTNMAKDDRIISTEPV